MSKMLNVHDGEQYTAEQRDFHDSDAVHGEHDDGNGNGNGDTLFFVCFQGGGR
jgi:hypothetical protein